jgi:hypothetical protein
MDSGIAALSPSTHSSASSSRAPARQ